MVKQMFGSSEGRVRLDRPLPLDEWDDPSGAAADWAQVYGSHEPPCWDDEADRPDETWDMPLAGEDD